MANHPSAKKRARQNEVRRVRNRSRITRVRGSVKAVREAVAAGDQSAAQAALQAAIPAIDKAAAQGVIHRRNASRRISRLNRLVNTLDA